MIRWFLIHYSSFVDRIIIYDEQSNDGTREIIQSCPVAEVREWRHKGLDDEKFTQAVNSIYKEARGNADWVIWADVDELVFHPSIRGVLSVANESMVLSRGYALISETGEVSHRPGFQLYELVKTGYPQPNYDKLIVWKPEAEVVHTIGRHTYPGWPKCSGSIGSVPRLKLFHCHHIGGVYHTEKINSRNFSRAVNKQYAWNYTPQHNTPQQVGTSAWVRDLIDGGKLYDVVSDVKKVNFGCGGNRIPGWENYDLEVDISKPLPFPDSSVDYILAEHCVEHVSHKDAWLFFKECKRILKIGGVVRIAVPDVARMQKRMTEEYINAVRGGGHGDDPIRAAIFEHGHMAAWTCEILCVFLSAIGFSSVVECDPGFSSHRELCNVEGHWRVVGKSIADVETGVVEGVR